MTNKKILITGANGQLGTVLAERLNSKYGIENVILTDIRKNNESDNLFIILDVLDKVAIINLVRDYKITDVYHLAAILSAKAENNPSLSWDVNFNGTLNIMNVVKSVGHDIKMFFPSSMAVFGATSPKENTPQDTVLLPTSNYGMAKVAGELWSNYFYTKNKTDIRGLRFPGIISYQSEAGGGTTDYAMEMYLAAVNNFKYTCFLRSDTRLPMMYVDDAMRAVIELMEHDTSNIRCRTAYNLAAISFTPEELFDSIKRFYPDFEIEYVPDFRQSIADSWCDTIDDSVARNEWGWEHKYDLDRMTGIMIKNLKLKNELCQLA